MYEVILMFPPFSQDPKKIDLVGKLVRGMRVEDVLSQLKVTDKQAAKTMYQVIQCFSLCLLNRLVRRNKFEVCVVCAI